MQSLPYRLPQTVYSDAFWEHIDRIIDGRPSLILTANREHREWLQLHLPQRVRGFPTIATVQGYMLTALTATAPRRVVTSYERTLLVGRAWQAVGGPLYDRYGKNRGADREMADILSYLSSQRTRWRVAHDIDTTHELGRIYSAYQSLMNELELFAYDDLALHFHDLDDFSETASVLCAVELQNSTAAQLTALRRIIDNVTDGVVGAWVPNGTPVPNPVPEHAVIERFLAEYSAMPFQETLDTASAQLIERLASTPTKTPRVRLFSMTEPKTPRRVGVLTTTDELQLTALCARAALDAGSSVSIVCADTALIGPLESALRDQGIPLPVLSPPHQSNPLIHMCMGLLRICSEIDPTQTVAHVHELTGIIRRFDTATPQRQQPDPTIASLGDAIEASARQLDLAAPLSRQLYDTVSSLGLLTSVWASPSHTPSRVRDYWLKEWQQWLSQVDTVTNMFGGADAQRIERILQLNATPQPTRILQHQDTRLTICGPRGAPHEKDALIVIGLHEGVAPRRPRGFQLVQEHEIAAALREPPAALPARIDRAATRERERRRVALMVASEAKTVTLGFAYHGINGQKILPTAFFEQWGAGAFSFDRDGNITLAETCHEMTLVHTAALPMPFSAKTEQTDRMQVVHDNHFSNSQIRSYLSCPRKYFYEKVARVSVPAEEGDEAHFVLGNLMHEVLCAAMGTGELEEVDLREESFELFAQRWEGMTARANRILDHALAGTPCDLGNSQWYTPKKAYRDALGGGLLTMLAEKEARAMIVRWIAAENTHLKPGLQRRPFLLEQAFSCHIEGMEIIGRIDRVDVVKTEAGLVYEIIDYKTTTAKPLSGNALLKEFAPHITVDASEEDESTVSPLPTNYQTLLYLYANRTGAPSKFPPPLRMHYVFINQPDSKKRLNTNLFRRIDVHPSETAAVTYENGKTTMLNVTAELLKTTAETTMRDTMIAMRHTPYPIQPGQACTYCSFLSICDATLDDQQGAEENR